jgi:hypothetical protein
MANRLPNVGVPDGLALAGGVLVFLHEFVETVFDDDKSFTFRGGLRLLGIAIVLAGVWATLHRVLEALKKMTEAQTVALGSLEVAEGNRLLGEVERWRQRNPEAVHVSATQGVAMHLLTGYVPQLIGRVQAFCGSPRETGTIHVEEQSPVHDLLANLAEYLPADGVWLGVTLVEQVRTWSEPEEVFSRFAETMRRRAGSGEVVVGRIYHFTSEAAEREMAAALKIEARSNVTVRCLISGDDRKDMSILYAPPKNQVSRLAPPLEGDCVQSLEKAGYRLICTVEFHTRADGVLRGASIYGAAHPDSRVVLGRFRSRWRESLPCTAGD